MRRLSALPDFRAAVAIPSRYGAGNVRPFSSLAVNATSEDRERVPSRPSPALISSSPVPVVSTDFDLSSWIRALVAAGRLGRREECLKLLASWTGGDVDHLHQEKLNELSSFDLSLTLWAVAKGCCYAAAREGVGEAARRGGTTPVTAAAHTSVEDHDHHSANMKRTNAAKSFSTSPLLASFFRAATGHLLRDLTRNGTAYSTESLSQILYAYGLYESAGLAEAGEAGARRNSLFVLLASELATKRRVWNDEDSDRTIPTIFGTLADHFLLNCNGRSGDRRALPEQRLPVVARLVEKLFVMMEEDPRDSHPLLQGPQNAAGITIKKTSHATKIRSNVWSLAVLANALSRITLLYPVNDRTGLQLRKLQVGVWQSIVEAEGNHTKRDIKRDTVEMNSCEGDARPETERELQLGVPELRTLLAAVSRTRRMTDQGAGSGADAGRFLRFLARKIHECLRRGCTSGAGASVANLAALSAYTFAQCRFHPGDSVLEACSSVDFPQSADRDFASLIFGFAVLNYDGFRPERHRDVVKGMAAKARANWWNCQLQDRNAACAVWSLCALEHYEVARGLYKEVFQTRSGKTVDFSTRPDLPDTEKGQLAYARLCFRLFCRTPAGSTSSSVSSAAVDDADNRRDCTTSRAVGTTLPQSTQMHSQIFSAVKQIWPEALCEGVLPGSDGLLLVDIMLPKLRVAVEVDGRRHFLTGREEAVEEDVASRMIDGPTSLKHRLIRKLGWRLVVVTAEEWKAAVGLTEEAKKKFVREKIFATGAGEARA